MVTIFFEPTDRRKACKILQGLQQGRNLSYASPNLSELRAMVNFIKPNHIADTTTQFNEIIDLTKIVSHYVNTLIVTLGSKGVLVVHRLNESETECLIARMYSVNALSHVENVSGAGDCFSSGFIHGTLLGLDESQCVAIGFEAAKLALLCKQTVPLKFNFQPNIEGAIFDTSRYEINQQSNKHKY